MNRLHRISHRCCCWIIIIIVFSVFFYPSSWRKCAMLMAWIISHTGQMLKCLFPSLSQTQASHAWWMHVSTCDASQLSTVMLYILWICMDEEIILLAVCPIFKAPESLLKTFTLVNCRCKMLSCILRTQDQSKNLTCSMYMLDELVARQIHLSSS